MTLKPFTSTTVADYFRNMKPNLDVKMMDNKTSNLIRVKLDFITLICCEPNITYRIYYDLMDESFVNTILDIGIHHNTLYILTSIMSLEPRDPTIIHGGIICDGNFNAHICRPSGIGNESIYYY
jgi:hypothetical protein